MEENAQESIPVEGGGGDVSAPDVGAFTGMVSQLLAQAEGLGDVAARIEEAANTVVSKIETVQTKAVGKIKTAQTKAEGVIKEEQTKVTGIIDKEGGKAVLRINSEKEAAIKAIQAAKPAPQFESADDPDFQTSDRIFADHDLRN